VTGFDNFLEELHARTEINDVLLRYCRAVDRSDWDLLRTVYHPDAYDDHGVFKGSVEEFIAYDIERREHIEHSVHMISNVQIEFRGTTEAVVETYCLALQRFGRGADVVRDGNAAARIQAICRYVDRFEERNGAWKIAHRTMVTGDLIIEQVSEPVTFSGERVVQRPDTSDFLYEVLEAKGF
jgi:hypothetical protein